MNTFFRWATACIVVFASIFLIYGSFTDSAIMDELAHIPSGYSYVRHFDFRLNPEHPPLLKALAGGPLLFLNLNFPTDRRWWSTDVNGQWDAGTDFLYRSGNDADLMVRVSRLGPILLTILLIIFLARWGREMSGSAWGIIGAIFLAFSPSFLAHGRYVTTDVAAAFGIVTATYYFLRYLQARTRKNFLLAAVFFGVAQSAKFSAVLLLPFFVGLAVLLPLLQSLADTASVRARLVFFIKNCTGWLLRTGMVFAVGFILIVYPLYFAFTYQYPIERQVADTRFILSSFAEGPTPEGQLCKPTRCLADATIAMAGNTITRPLAHYALGVLMVIQRAAGGNTAYFLGKVSSTGSSLYFPVVYLLKEPIPVLIAGIIAAIAGILALWRSFRLSAGSFMSRAARFVLERFSYFAIGIFAAAYWAYSIRSPLNIGFRHLFPALPFMYLLTAAGLKHWIAKPELPQAPSMHDLAFFMGRQARNLLRLGILAVLIIWLVIETTATAPNHLSYFNQLGGGTWSGYRYVTDSNYDWGQDMLRLKAWLEEHPEVDTFAIDYFGGGNPAYYFGGRAVSWSSSRGDPRDIGIRWVVISVNSLQGSIQPPNQWFKRNPQDEYRWLTDTFPKDPALGMAPEPYARAGTSLFIYKLP